MERPLSLGPGSNTEGCRVLPPQPLPSSDQPVPEQPVGNDQLDTHSCQLLQSESMDDDLIHRLNLAWRPSGEMSGRLIYRPQGYLH